MREEIQLTKEKKAKMISEIKTYFAKEREEDLGDLAADIVLRFVIEKLAPEFYNQGVLDSYKYLGSRVEDILSLQK